MLTFLEGLRGRTTHAHYAFHECEWVIYCAMKVQISQSSFSQDLQWAGSGSILIFFQNGLSFSPGTKNCIIQEDSFPDRM